MTDGYRLEDYDYPLAPDCIAQYPTEERMASRLLVLDRATGKVVDGIFCELLEFLSPGDCLVVNDSRVFAARIRGHKPTGGQVEFFLLHYPKEVVPGQVSVRALYRASKGIRPGVLVHCKGSLSIEVGAVYSEGQADLQLNFLGDLLSVLEECGEVPLPPYICRGELAMDRERYQTVYASRVGSVAAPTAGLHFTPWFLDQVEAQGVRLVRITLHVGYGTFAPVRVPDIRQHRVHSEWLSVSRSAVEGIAATRREGGRVVAVGTTSVRGLETAADGQGGIRFYEGLCDLYILPGYRFQVVDRLLTNFHLPCSSLLVLVSAFAGREKVLGVYAEAEARGYRFYSYGDAMLIL